MLKDHAVLYERGRREKNEDSILLECVHTACGETLLAAVCDGVGGLDCGEIASGCCVEELAKWFYGEYMGLLEKGKSRKTVINSMYRLLYRLHKEIKMLGKRSGIRLGTTASILLCRRNRYLVFHCGDSGILRFGKRNGSLTRRQVTEQGMLAGCIGCGMFSRLQIKSGIIWPGDGFLLMSDGLMHHNTESEFGSLKDGVFKSHKLTHDARVRRLAEFAKRSLARGEDDNMSAIYLQF